MRCAWFVDTCIGPVAEEEVRQLGSNGEVRLAPLRLHPRGEGGPSGVGSV